MKAVQITEFGGSDSLRHVDLPEPEPGEGEIVIDVARVGVNFADTHQTHNAYIAKQTLPLVPGAEVAGTTPDGVRVAAILPNGAYAQRVAVPEASLVPIPDAVGDDQAAALLLQGLTAWAILEISGRLAEGESVVIHAAAGGTGSLAVQLAKRMKAGNIIALASSEDKREMTLGLGADRAIDSRAEDLEAAILGANDGEMVDVVLEMAGGEAFEASLRALAPFGRLVTFGIASREQNAVKTGHLMRNSRAVIGFWITHLLARPDLLRQGIEAVMGAAAAGDLRAVIGGVEPLSEAAAVHEAMVARRTQGKMLLDPTR